MDNRGFGFDPDVEKHHFIVFCGPRYTTVCEREHWDMSVDWQEERIRDKIVALMPVEMWSVIEGAVEDDFSRQLGYRARFEPNGTLMRCFYGRQLLVLMWALEDRPLWDAGRALAGWSKTGPADRIIMYAKAVQSLPAEYGPYLWRELCGNDDDDDAEP